LRQPPDISRQDNRKVSKDVGALDITHFPGNPPYSIPPYSSCREASNQFRVQQQRPGVEHRWDLAGLRQGARGARPSLKAPYRTPQRPPEPRDSPSPSKRFENPMVGAGLGHGQALSSFDNSDGCVCANRRPVASCPGSRLGTTARLPKRGVVGSGRQRVSTAGGAGGLPERRVVGSGRQCLQATRSAVSAELWGRTVLESGFQRLSAAWPGLGG
jgi:hypothetical protein